MPDGELELRIMSRLGDLAPDWDELASRTTTNATFLRSWWVEHVAEGEPVLLCWFEGDELVGGAALELDRPGRGRLSFERVRSLGQGVLAPDHLDLMADERHRGTVARQLAEWLHRPGSRLVDLDGLAAEGLLATAFAEHEIERVGAPYAVLPEATDAYLAARPGQVRSTIKRTAKRFARDGVNHRSVSPDRAGHALDELARLHEGRWAEESSFLSAWERFRTAALAGMAAGEVTIDELVTGDGTVVATELDIVVGGGTAFYQAGRSTDREWRGGGSVLRAEIVRRAIAAGHGEYDLLRGDEPYKSDWSEHRREVVRVRFGVGPVGGAAMVAIAVVSWVLTAGTAAWRRTRPVRDRLSRAASRPGRSPRPAPPD